MGAEQALAVVFLMISRLIAGTLSFRGLGRGETRPSPCARCRRSRWPGATGRTRAQAGDERLSARCRKPNTSPVVRSYTIAGQTTIFIDLKGSTAPSAVPTSWTRCARTSATCAARCRRSGRPFFTTTSVTPFAFIYAFTADGSTSANFRDYVDSRTLAAGCPSPTLSKIEVLGRRTSRSTWILHRAPWPDCA